MALRSPGAPTTMRSARALTEKPKLAGRPIAPGEPRRLHPLAVLPLEHVRSARVAAVRISSNDAKYARYHPLRTSEKPNSSPGAASSGVEVSHFGPFPSQTPEKSRAIILNHHHNRSLIESHQNPWEEMLERLFLPPEKVGL